jgi:hypothetical protein
MYLGVLAMCPQAEGSNVDQCLGQRRVGLPDTRAHGHCLRLGKVHCSSPWSHAGCLVWPGSMIRMSPPQPSQMP